MNVQVVEPKPGLNVGRIVVDMKVENLADLYLADQGLLPADQVRSLEVQALVDTGATLVGLPSSDIAHLGLRPVRQRRAHTAARVVAQQIYSVVRVTVQGRDCPVEVMELHDGSPALLGQLALEALDFWIDMTNRRLTGNPEHGGEWMHDMF
jgi:predicted aspartyl protease